MPYGVVRCRYILRTLLGPVMMADPAASMLRGEGLRANGAGRKSLRPMMGSSERLPSSRPVC